LIRILFETQKNVFLQNADKCMLKENTIVVKRLMIAGDFLAECPLKLRDSQAEIGGNFERDISQKFLGKM